jgi:subfamily B ATP-binding cassette protein MsbA
MLASVRHNFQLVSGLFAKDPQNPYYRSFELVWSFARHYRWRISSIFFLNFLSALFESNSLTLLVLALTSLLGGDMSDAASRFGALGDLFLQVQRSMSPTAFFFVLAGIAIGSQVLKSGITLASGLSSSYLNSALSESSKVMVYERLNSIPYAQLMKYKLGDVANYIGYTNTIGRMISLVNQTLNLFFNMAIYVGVLFWLSVPMTLATFAVFGLIGIGLFVITQRIHHYEQISFENRKRFNQQIFENVQALRLLTIMNQNHRTIEATRELANLEREVHYRGNALRLLISPILEITALLSVTAFIVIGYFFAGGLNADTLPGIIVFMLALWRIVPRLAQFNGIITSFASYQLHLVELADMLEITSQLQAPRSLAPFHGLHDRIRYEGCRITVYCWGEQSPQRGDV